MTENNTNLNDEFLDDAAAEAIGAHTVEESDAFAIALARADEGQRQTTRDLRDTVARMAGLSPYLEPPVSLRGAILEATAPKTFKIDEYRRNSDVAPKWLRRSLVASIAFLIFAAWYNATAMTTIKQQTAQINQMKEAIDKAKPQFAQMASSNQQLTDALTNAQTSLAKATLANPRANRWIVAETTGEKRILVEVPESNQLLLLMPDRELPPGLVRSLTVSQKDGTQKDIQVLVIGKSKDTPREFAVGPLDGNKALNVNMKEVPGDAPRNAGFEFLPGR